MTSRQMESLMHAEHRQVLADFVAPLIAAGRAAEQRVSARRGRRPTFIIREFRKGNGTRYQRVEVA